MEIEESGFAIADVDDPDEAEEAGFGMEDDLLDL